MPRASIPSLASRASDSARLFAQNPVGGAPSLVPSSAAKSSAAGVTAQRSLYSKTCDAPSTYTRPWDPFSMSEDAFSCSELMAVEVVGVVVRGKLAKPGTCPERIRDLLYSGYLPTEDTTGDLGDKNREPCAAWDALSPVDPWADVETSGINRDKFEFFWPLRGCYSAVVNSRSEKSRVKADSENLRAARETH